MRGVICPGSSGVVRPVGRCPATGYLAIRGALRYGHTSGYAKTRLCALGRFFGFVQLRGACSARLVDAIPRVPNFFRSYNPGGLTDSQRKELLRSFDRQTAQGRCEHAAALCMVELGLRNCEVVHLRLQDLDWDQGIVRVPVMKTGHRTHRTDANVRARGSGGLHQRFSRNQCQRSRILAPRQAGRAPGQHPLHPDGDATGLPPLRFSRSRRRYSRLATHLCYAAALARRRHARDRRPLGHQDPMTTSLYTDVAVSDMRVLVQPWPLKP